MNLKNCGETLTVDAVPPGKVFLIQDRSGTRVAMKLRNTIDGGSPFVVFLDEREGASEFEQAFRPFSLDHFEGQVALVFDEATLSPTGLSGPALGGDTARRGDLVVLGRDALLIVGTEQSGRMQLNLDTGDMRRFATGQSAAVFEKWTITLPAGEPSVALAART
jgi:hypothetical protein